jgi:hypothetical protein
MNRLEQLVNDLTRPLFVWRMARGMVHQRDGQYVEDPQSRGQKRSARTRLRSATIQMDRLVLAYAADRLAEYWGEYEGNSSIAQAMGWLRAPNVPEEAL